MTLFPGATVVISGAARGQGRSHAVRFAREGADVVAFDLCGQIDSVPFAMSTPEDLAETARLVRAEGARIHVAVADVRDPAAVDRVVAEGVEAFGGPDVVLANAGIVGRPAKLWEVTEEVFRDVIDVNLIGVWHVVKSGVAAMLSGGRRGSVVVTGSGASLKGLPNIGPYVASKHALVGLVRTAARELAPHGIRVNLVAPGNANTPMFDNEAMRRLYVPGEHEVTQEAFLARAAAGVPMGVPYVEAADVTEAVVYLASEAARYVTGVVLPVDAGSAMP